MKKSVVLLFLAFGLSLVWAEELKPQEPHFKDGEHNERYEHQNGEHEVNSAIVGARFESCAGCRLNKLPKLRNFLQKQAILYPKVEVKYIPGVDPRVVFLNSNGDEVERQTIAHLDETQLHTMLESKGFQKTNPE